MLIITPGILIKGFHGMGEAGLTTRKFSWLGQFPPSHDIS